MDYVQVEGLTYETDLALQVGDMVEVPPTFWQDGPRQGRVTALGRGDYNGPCKRIIRRVGASEQRAQQLAMDQRIARREQLDQMRAAVPLLINDRLGALGRYDTARIILSRGGLRAYCDGSASRRGGGGNPDAPMYSLANELFDRCYQQGGVALSSMSAAERARAIAEFIALRMEVQASWS
jgi:hypothetical protein